MEENFKGTYLKKIQTFRQLRPTTWMGIEFYTEMNDPFFQMKQNHFIKWHNTDFIISNMT